MSSEPVRIITLVVSAVLLALPHLSTWGVPLSQERLDSLMTFLPALVALIGGEVARTYVSPVQKGQ